MTKKPKARMDEVELAKSIFDEIVEETESEDWNKPKKASAQKGGKVRAAKLTPAERSAIAKKAAQSRWGNKS
ncbi:MAG: histone H1 [Pyrinomonadaceae bacterium]